MSLRLTPIAFLLFLPSHGLSLEPQSPTQLEERGAREPEVLPASLPRPIDVMILGVFHFNQELSADFDVLRPQEQVEIEEIVKDLHAFDPDKVFVEWQAYFKQEEVDATYGRYRAGDFVLSRNEVHQLGFRLAAAADLDRVHCADHAGIWMGAQVNEAAEKYGQQEVLEGTAPGTMKMPYELESGSEFLARTSIREFLRHMNDPGYQVWGHNWYINRAIRIGDDDDEVGGELVAHWYRRNLLIYRNMLSAIEEGDRRVVLIIGSGHGQILRNLFRDNLHFRLVEPNDYL